MGSNIKSFVSALAVGFIDNFGLSLVFIVFAPLILNPGYHFFSPNLSEGTKNILLGIGIGAFPFFQFFGAPFWGDVGDRWGRKKALIFTLLGTVIGHLITALSIYASSFFFLLISRMIAGFFSGNASICMAIVSDLSSDPKLKARNFGILTVFWGLGFILAMIIGGFLSDPQVSVHFNPMLPFWVAVVLTFIGFIIVKLIFKETHRPETSVHFDWIRSVHEITKAIQVSELRPILFTILLWSMGWFINFQWFTPISIEKFSSHLNEITWVLVIFGFFWTLGGSVINPFLVKKYPSQKLALCTILIVAFFVGLSAISVKYTFFSLFFMITSFLSPVSLSNLFNLVSLSSPKEFQGKAMGFAQSFFSLSGIIVPLGGGALADLSIDWLYPVASICLLVAFVFLFNVKTPSAL